MTKKSLEEGTRCVACHHSRRPAPRDEVLAVRMVGTEPLCAFHAVQAEREPIGLEPEAIQAMEDFDAWKAERKR